jgi:hypothetical protein
MLEHTDRPLEHLSMGHTTRALEYFVHAVESGRMLLDAPYQRGAAWLDDQSGNLIKSFLMGLPIPAVVLNKRLTDAWERANGFSPYNYAVIDGKQRLLTVCAWFNDDLAVPGTWFPADWLAGHVPVSRRMLVTFRDLSGKGRRGFENFQLACVEAQVTSVRAEAEIYLLVNGAGTAQTDDDIVNAQRVAEGG